MDNPGNNMKILEIEMISGRNFKWEIGMIRKEVGGGLRRLINLAMVIIIIIMKGITIISNRRWRPNSLWWKMGVAWSVWKLSLSPGRVAYVRYPKLRGGQLCLLMAASFVIAKDVTRSTSSSKKGRKWKPSSSRMVMANSLGKGRDCLIQTMILTMKAMRIFNRGHEWAAMDLLVLDLKASSTMTGTRPNKISRS